MNRRAFLNAAIAGCAAGALGGREARAPAGTPSANAKADRLNAVPPAEEPNESTAAGALSEHRVAKIETVQLQDRYPRLVGANAKRGAHGRGGSYKVRLITTDQGATGWGMSAAPEEQTQEFVGARVSDIFEPDNGAAEEAFCLDFALHDLAGRILGTPVYALLGGAGPKEVPIYSGAIYLDDLEPQDSPRGVEGVLASCRQDYEAGYRGFKLKIGRGFKWMPRAEGLRRDIEVTRAVRERFPDCRILVDGNDGYEPADFQGYVRAVADCGLFFIEEPFPEERDSLLRLRETMSAAGCKALIAEGEGRTDKADTPWRYGGYSQRHIDRLYALAAEKLVDVFVLDLSTVGFTRWRHVMPELAQAGVLAAPHTWGGTLRPFYTAHLAAGVGNVVIVEGVPGQANGVDYSAYRLVQGNLAMPASPGFGLSLQAPA